MMAGAQANAGPGLSPVPAAETAGVPVGTQPPAVPVSLAGSMASDSTNAPVLPPLSTDAPAPTDNAPASVLRCGGRTATEIEKGPAPGRIEIAPLPSESETGRQTVAVATTDPSGDNIDRFIQSHFRIGTRVTWFLLDDSKRKVDMSDSYYGSITELRAIQNWIPYKLYADIMINPYIGVEITWDQIRADTITRSDGHNDGTIDLKGPMAGLLVRYPNATCLTPYGGAGAAWFRAEFDEDFYWQYPRDYYEQEIDLQNTWGWFAYLGLSIRIWDRWSADLYYRHTDVSVDGSHWQWNQERQSGTFTFPLSNEAFGLGASYTF